MAKWPRYFDLFLMLLQLSLGIVISQAAIVDMEKACRVTAYYGTSHEHQHDTMAKKECICRAEDTGVQDFEPGWLGD